MEEFTVCDAEGNALYKIQSKTGRISSRQPTLQGFPSGNKNDCFKRQFDAREEACQGCIAAIECRDGQDKPRRCFGDPPSANPDKPNACFACFWRDECAQEKKYRENLAIAQQAQAYRSFLDECQPPTTENHDNRNQTEGDERPLGDHQGQP